MIPLARDANHLLAGIGEVLVELTQYIFVPDEIIEADAALVFGATSWPRCLEVALELYRSGLVRFLVLSGGFNPRLGLNEAEAMRAAALEAGVPAWHLLTDSCSTNTMENAVHSLRLLRAAGPVRRILPVTIHYHTRRVRLTLEHCLQGTAAIGSTSYSSAFYSARDWQNNDRGRRDVVSELRKIERYFPFALPPRVRAAARVLSRGEGEEL